MIAHSDCSLMLEIFTKGTRFFKDSPLDLRVIQAYHSQVSKSCQQLLTTANTVLLEMLGRNFKKDCCSYSLLPRRENGTSEKSVGEGPRPVISFGAVHGREVTAFCCVFAKHLFPYLILMLRAHLRLAGALGYLSWI